MAKQKGHSRGKKDAKGNYLGAIPWDDLPGYVKWRLSMKPFADTKDDKYLQEIYAGAFLCTNPAGKIREIWITCPVGARNGVSRGPELRYPGEPHPPVDARAVLALRMMCPEHVSAEVFNKYSKELTMRLKKDEEAQIRLMNAVEAEDLAQFQTDQNRQGKILRPVRPVSVPANLVSAHLN